MAIESNINSYYEELIASLAERAYDDIKGGSDEDEAFAAACAAHFANVRLACEMAAADLEPTKRDDKPARLKYIESISEKYAAD